MNCKKILLVHLNSNGDCLYATAIAKQIKNDFPGCHLTWAIASSCKNILINNPFVDTVWEVNNVPKDDITAFRHFIKDSLQLVKQGKYNELFVTQIQDRNLALYDGCIRSAIFNAYPHPITVPIQPVLFLTEKEKERVRSFVESHDFSKYEHLILFEFAPQSGQSNITTNTAISIAENLTTSQNIAVILSSNKKIMHSNRAIIDGSAISLRETAYLTNFCTFLVGTSSGITWISTSNAGHILPMVQLLNSSGKWLNSISRDFDRFDIPHKSVIELLNYNESIIVDCIKTALKDFEIAKKIFNQSIPLNFKTTRDIVYSLLCYFHFKSILRHINCNIRASGFHINLFFEVFLGFILLPYFLARNKFKKARKMFANL